MVSKSKNSHIYWCMEMYWSEIFQILSGVIISFGGAAVIVWKVSSHLGKIWSQKYLEGIKNEYKKEIESYKTDLSVLKETTLRYSGQQFELYNKLWCSLCDLKSAADLLWVHANKQNLVSFSNQLQSTMDNAEKSYLFIEEDHYRALSKLLDEFKNYEIGKKKVIQFQSALNRESVDSFVDQESNIGRQQHLEESIKQLIYHNMERKRQYERLIKKIGDNLKKQLNGRK